MLRVQSILQVAQGITIDDLSQTEEILKKLNEAKSAEDVEKIANSLPLRIITILRAMKDEYEDINQTIVERRGDKADTNDANNEAMSRIPFLPQLISVDVSSRLVVLEEILSPYYDLMNPVIARFAETSFNPMRFLVPKIAEKRLENNMEILRHLREENAELSKIKAEAPDGFSYAECQEHIKKKRREANQAKEQELKQDTEYQGYLRFMEYIKLILASAPEGKRLEQKYLDAINKYLKDVAKVNLDYTGLQDAIKAKTEINTILQNDPDFVRYSDFVNGVDEIKERHTTEMKKIRNQDATEEGEKVGELKVATKFAAIQQATKDYYTYLMQVVDKALNDNPDLSMVLQMEHTFDAEDHSMKNVPGIILLAEQMHLLFLEQKNQLETKSNNFSNLTNYVDGTMSEQRRAALVALPKTTQLALLKLQTVNELQNKLNNPNNTQKAKYDDAADYLGNKERQELLMTRRDNAGRVFLKCLASVGLVVSGQFSKLSQLWKTKGHAFLTKAADVEPEIKLKK